MTIQTITEEIVVSKEDVKSVQGLSKSLMPDGLLTQLTDQQIADLFAYMKNATSPPTIERAPPRGLGEVKSD